MVSTNITWLTMDLNRFPVAGTSEPLWSQVLDSGFPEVGIAMLLLSWLTWRLYRFTLCPLLDPSEPKALPYWLPGMGHAIPFFRNSYAVFARARVYFGDARPPYSLIIGGQKLYVVTDPKDVQELYYNATSLSWESFVRDMFRWVGLSETAQVSLWTPPATENAERRLSPELFTEDCQRKQLLPGPKSAPLVDHVLKSINQKLDWDGLNTTGAYIHRRSGKEIEVDLIRWTTHTIVGILTEAYWGRKLSELNPAIISDYMAWDDTNWKYIFQLPKPFAHDMYTARDALISTFQRYFELPISERQDSNWYVPTHEETYRAAGVGTSDIGRVQMLIHWAINGNVHKVLFWMLSHILHDPMLHEKIKAETATNIDSGELQVDTLIDSCPQLEAVWFEVLRMYTTTSLMRTVTRDTQIGKFTLKRGYNVMVPYRELHYNSDIWGKESERFDHTRFLNDPSLKKNQSFRPFGGGSHLCPGRFMAKQMAFSFVALALHQLNAQIKDSTGGKAQFPRSRVDKPALGTMAPLSTDRVFVTLRQ